MEPSIRVVERAAPCAFHGAHDFLRNDLDPSEYLGCSQKKVYQDLYELGELFKSLATSEYPEGRLLPQLKELFLWLHGKGSAIATESLHSAGRQEHSDDSPQGWWVRRVDHDHLWLQGLQQNE